MTNTFKILALFMVFVGCSTEGTSPPTETTARRGGGQDVDAGSSVDLAPTFTDTQAKPADTTGIQPDTSLLKPDIMTVADAMIAQDVQKEDLNNIQQPDTMIKRDIITIPDTFVQPDLRLNIDGTLKTNICVMDPSGIITDNIVVDMSNGQCVDVPQQIYVKDDNTIVNVPCDLYKLQGKCSPNVGYPLNKCGYCKVTCGQC